MKKILTGIFALLFAFSLTACSGISGAAVAGKNGQTASQQEKKTEEPTAKRAKTKALGGLEPQKAWEYMKATPDLVIVQVNTAQWKIEPGFSGALWIPHDEMAKRYDEIPKGKPVMLHCGGGIVSVPAYELLLEKRPDIPELSYIAGSPHSLFDRYNRSKQNKIE